MYIALGISVIVLIWLILRQPADKVLRGLGLVALAAAITGAVLYGLFVFMSAAW